MGKLFRKALPAIGTIAGAYFGSFVGAPQAGAAIGGSIGAAASDALTPDPSIPKPKVIPLPDEEALTLDRKRKQRSAGRASTIFTDVSGATGSGGTDRLGP